MDKIKITSNLENEILEKDLEVELLEFVEIDGKKFPKDDFLWKNNKTAYYIWLKLRVRNTVNNAYLYLSYEFQTCWGACLTKKEFVDGINYLLEKNYIQINF